MIARLASIFVLSTFLSQTSHALESKCFSMQPKGSLNEKTCAPVPVTITYKDCDSGAAGSVVDGVARFECKGKVKRLKYWHDDAMLIGVLERSGSGYNVAKTFAQGGILKPKATPAPIAEQTPVPTPMPTASIPVALNPLEATPTPATAVKSESVLNK
ncbi:MAG: hypothetical protein IT289_12355, partial [Oligoflexia bacterium]|nr:hypothetical protein [Oligoflexia bacterium]